jgi:hypothetical protein
MDDGIFHFNSHSTRTAGGNPSTKPPFGSLAEMVGWAMCTGNGDSGLGSSRCWKYHRNGDELAVITYQLTTGNLTLVKSY